MVQHKPKACQFCCDKFTPHPKVGLRQIACKKPECQRARKRENLKRFYRSDPGYNYDNVKRYRASHPDYQKQWRQKRKENLNAQYLSLEEALKTPETPGSQQQQQIPASLFVSSKASEIQTAIGFWPSSAYFVLKNGDPHVKKETNLSGPHPQNPRLL